MIDRFSPGGIRPVTVAADALHDLKVRAAWLYHVEGLTQEQVSRAIGVSRAKVVRLLAGARDEGIVRIRVGAKAADTIALERRLIDRFALAEAVVAPEAADESQVAATVGLAAAVYLTAQMRDGIALGVGWGATLDVGATSVQPQPYPGAAVVSLLGGMTHSRGVNPSAVARRLADAFRAECYQLTAPLVVASEAMRDALWAEPALAQLRSRAQRVDLALVSVGDVSERATLFREGLLPLAELDSLRAAGAVGDVLCRFVDRAGRPVEHPLNRRVVGIGLDELTRVPRIVIASGGERKVEALHGALAALRVHALITDETAARGLLAG